MASVSDIGIDLGTSSVVIYARDKGDAADWKEGDIVFQISMSEQSPLIQYATGSPWSRAASALTASIALSASAIPQAGQISVVLSDLDSAEGPL